MSDNIYPSNSRHERQPKLNSLQHESTAARWSVRHNAAARGSESFYRLFPAIITSTQRTEALGANVVDIASHPDYHYHSQDPSTTQPAEAPATGVYNTELDADAIRMKIEGLHGDQKAA